MIVSSASRVATTTDGKPPVALRSLYMIRSYNFLFLSLSLSYSCRDQQRDYREHSRDFQPNRQASDRRHRKFAHGTASSNIRIWICQCLSYIPVLMDTFLHLADHHKSHHGHSYSRSGSHSSGSSRSRHNHYRHDSRERHCRSRSRSRY